MLSVAPKTDPTNESGSTTPAPDTKPKPLDLKNDSDFGASGTGLGSPWCHGVDVLLFTPGMKHMKIHKRTHHLWLGDQIPNSNQSLVSLVTLVKFFCGTF